MDFNEMMQPALKMCRNMMEEQIEAAQDAIAREKRKIRRSKTSMKLIESLAKELAKPPKPFKYPKPTKAQRKAMQEAQKRMGFPVAASAMPVRPV